MTALGGRASDRFLAVSFVGTLEHHRLRTFRARFADRTIPDDEIAFRIVIASVKDTASFAASFDELAVGTLRARHADLLEDRLGVAAIREARAGEEFAKASVLVNHQFAALFTLDVRHFVFEDDMLHLFFRDF